MRNHLEFAMEHEIERSVRFTLLNQRIAGWHPPTAGKVEKVLPLCLAPIGQVKRPFKARFGGACAKTRRIGSEILRRKRICWHAQGLPDYTPIRYRSRRGPSIQHLTDFALNFQGEKRRQGLRGSSMNNYLLLIACMLLGILLRRSGRLPDNAAAALNGFIVNVSLPALTLTYVHNLTFDSRLILPALMAWIMFAIGCAFFWLAARLLRFPREITGGLMLTGGLGNTSFVGLPMIETFYGPQFLGVGILIDQAGSYFVLSTLGIVVASLYASDSTITLKAVTRKIVLFAPFQAFVLALLLIPFEYPVWLANLFERLGATLVPLALVSVGYQLQFSQARGRTLALVLGLLFKLVIGPTVILLLFAGFLGAGGPVLRVTVFEAAMAPMIGASIVAMNHRLDPPLVTLMVGVGIPLSFLTLPAWWYVLDRVG